LTLLDKAQIFILPSCAGIVSLACLAFNNFLIIILVTIVIVFLSGMFVMRLGMIAALGHRLILPFPESWLTRVLDGFNLLNLQQLFHTLFVHTCFLWRSNFANVLPHYSFSQISLIHCFIGTSANDVCKITAPDFR